MKLSGKGSREMEQVAVAVAVAVAGREGEKQRVVSWYVASL